MTTTSGTTGFSPDFTEIAEEAWERAGRELRSGYDLRTARRSMNFLTIEWQNRGLDMWTFDQGTITLQQGCKEARRSDVCYRLYRRRIQDGT